MYKLKNANGILVKENNKKNDFCIFYTLLVSSILKVLFILLI